MEGQLLTGHPERGQPGKCYETQVQRPDTQDPPEIEAAQIQSSIGGPLAQHQTRNKVRAQSKEEINPISTCSKRGDKDVAQPMGVVGCIVELNRSRGSVKYEHPEECEEPQRIKLGAI